ncbi:MAG: ABC transporter ATP-binding protein [Gemmatimonadaceae bacterium]|nr:ABC transporter ATP-binding protein [Gemmatimonadaceae bacterium]
MAVRLHGVSRHFGKSNDALVRAVDGVSLSIRPGALTLVMGPSGSGKTTLLSLIGGLLAPSAGEVEVDGTRLAALAPAALTAFRLRRVGFVFQRFRLLDALSALENIELPLTLAGVGRPASRERAHALAARVGLSLRHDARAGTLSGGEQQRVAIARALANDPRILLADEPTGSLDSRAGQRIIELLHASAIEGTAVLVVSHDARLMPYAHTVVRMEDGHVTTIDTA